MKIRAGWVVGFGLFWCLTSPCVTEAQVPDLATARQMLSENPELVRQRLQESGLTDAEIRSRLAAAGLPTNALDGFLSGATGGAPALDASAFSALQLLGVTEIGLDGLEIVDQVQGMQDAVAVEPDGFLIFGHDVFSRATSQFQPLMSGPVSDEYVLGPGDQLLAVVTGDVQIVEPLQIGRDGAVVVPTVGRIPLANLTLGQARLLFRDRFAAFYSGLDRGTAELNLSISELRAIQVYVTGSVTQPGAYQLSSVATVTNALYAAGGPTALGNLRSVRVESRQGESHTLDLYPYLLTGDISGDRTLSEGDVVFIPPRERRVELHGAVSRPAAYEVTDEEGLADVLRSANGFAPRANRSRVTIHRVVRPADRGPGLGDRSAIDLALVPSDDPSAPNHVGGVLVPEIGLQDGDSIVVGAVVDLEDGFYVTITGMVAQPNRFPWREGMTLRDLMLLARGPTVGADLRQAEVTRLPDQRASGELADRIVVPLDSSYLSQRSPDGRYEGPPGVAFPPAGSAPEFALAPYDQVLVLRQPEFEMPRSVKITGEVSVPGEYTLLTKDDRVTDLVSRAGNVLDNGYLEGAQLYRSEQSMGRIDLQLRAALADPASDENVLLQPGDSLHIPTYTPTVVVRGAVNSQVTVLYREGQDFDYYISAAGGFRYDADKGRTSVRFANGLARTRSKFLFWSSYPTPDAGSTISVPTKDPDSGIDAVQLTTSLVSVLGTITTLVIVIVNNTGS